MGYGVTIFFYILTGTGVAVAMWLADDSTHESNRVFRTLTAPLFWPFYVPMLLVGHKGSSNATFLEKTTDANGRHVDGMDTLITQVERELEEALRSLDGWAEDPFKGEKDRIAELRTAWRDQAERLRELDRLLAHASIKSATSEAESTTPAHSLPIDEPKVASDDTPIQEENSIESSGSYDTNQSRIAVYEKARRDNLVKLKTVRQQMSNDLMATLAWVRELVTMIHLAKYTGAPASRAVELVQQIAAAVHGLSNHGHHESSISETTRP